MTKVSFGRKWFIFLIPQDRNSRQESKSKNWKADAMEGCSYQHAALVCASCFLIHLKTSWLGVVPQKVLTVQHQLSIRKTPHRLAHRSPDGSLFSTEKRFPNNSNCGKVNKAEPELMISKITPNELNGRLKISQLWLQITPCRNLTRWSPRGWHLRIRVRTGV